MKQTQQQMLGSSGGFVSREEHEAQMWQIRQEMTQMREEYEEQLSALSKKLQMAAENGGFQVGECRAQGMMKSGTALAATLWCGAHVGRVVTALLFGS